MSAILKDRKTHSPGDWKAKYYQLLNELDEKEKTWANEENQLFKSILRLIFSYNGLDPELNNELASMRETLRKGTNDSTRKNVIEKAIEHIIGYAKRRNDDHPSIRQSVQQLKIIINQLALPDSFRFEMDRLGVSLSNISKNDDVKTSCDQFVNIINKACSQPLSDNDKLSDKRPEFVEIKEEDIFEKFLQKLSLPGEAGSEIITLRKRVVELHEFQERLEIVDELVQLINRFYMQSNTIETDSETIDFTQLKEGLLQLIQWLPLPQKSEKKIETIKKLLVDLNDNTGLKKILRKVAAIISELQSSLQKELKGVETFLKKITSKLTELEKHIHDISSADIESQNCSKSLNESLKANMNNIREDIVQTNSIEIIQTLIEQRLMAIEHSMDAFFEAEQQRVQMSENRVKKLHKRIIQMKSETGNLQKRVEEEHYKAQIDALTGIPNRLAFDERMQEEFKRWQRYNHSLSICIIDIDKFKNVNDVYGHKAGDKVLATVAELCDSRIRETDFFARYGGEEFVLLLPETSLDQAVILAENLRLEVEECNFHYAQKPVAITISCGLAELKQNDTQDSVFIRADEALYAAKQAGRNQCKNENQI